MKLATFKFVIALSLFLTSMTVTITAQDSIPKERVKQPRTRKYHVSIPKLVKDSIDAATRIFDEKMVKYDSLLNEREKNIKNLESENSKLAKANQRFERVLSRFPVDSVKKFELDINDPGEINLTDSKKNFSLPDVQAPVVKKRTIWNKLNPFHKKQ